jgi:hypothetical protein
MLYLCGDMIVTTNSGTLRFSALLTMLVLVVFSISCKTTGLTKPQQVDQFKKMTWLAGEWQRVEGDFVYFESWKIEKDTLFLGRSVFVLSTDTILDESIRLEPGKLHIYYNSISENDGKIERTSYVLMKNSGKSMMFEDLGATMRRRIFYTMVGTAQLKIITEEREAGRKEKSTYILSRR